MLLGASPNTSSSEEAKEKSDAMPNISDVMLRKLKLHRGLPGWCVTTPAAGAHIYSDHLCVFIPSSCNPSFSFPFPVHPHSLKRKLRFVQVFT